MTGVSAREGYRLWAPSYSDETAISYLENILVNNMTPPLAGLRLLDAGCGTGRRLRNQEAATAVGLDICTEMLAAGDDLPDGVETIVGDVRELPFGARAFDVVWCRLVLGHLPDIRCAYAELARVADENAMVIVSDFHAAAHDAGHRRSFRAGTETIELEHHVHRQDRHISAARAAGLALVDVREARVGAKVHSFYESAGRAALFPDHVGLPVVLAMAFRREGRSCAC